MSDDRAGSPPLPASPTGDAGPRPTLSRDALEDIAAGLASVDREVTTGEGPVDSPRSLRLIATESYDVWLITWPPGSGIEEHDHGGALSVMRMVSGRLAERDAGRVRLVTADTSVVTAPHGSHRLWNPWPEDATSVHVYSPPLEEMTYWSTLVARALHPAGSGIESRPRPISPRPAEASTKRLDARSDDATEGQVDHRSIGSPAASPSPPEEAAGGISPAFHRRMA